MTLSITIAHTHTEANSRPSMTVLTSQCACQNSANRGVSEEVSGSTDCATSPGFIASRPYGHDPPDKLGRVRSMAAVENRTDACLDQKGRRAFALCDPPQTRDFTVTSRRPPPATPENPAKLDQTRAPDRA